MLNAGGPFWVKLAPWSFLNAHVHEMVWAQRELLALGVNYNENSDTLMRLYWKLPWQLTVARAIRLVV